MSQSTHYVLTALKNDVLLSLDDEWYHIPTNNYSFKGAYAYDKLNIFLVCIVLCYHFLTIAALFQTLNGQDYSRSKLQVVLWSLLICIN